MNEDTTEALALLRRAAAKRPDDVGIMQKLFAACIQTGLFDDATQAFFDLVTSRPDWPQVHFETLGRHAGRMLAQMLDAFERAATGQPSNSLGWYGIGLVQQLLQNQQAAADAFRKGLTAMPRFAALHYNLGVALMDDVAEATEELYQASACSGTMAEPHYALATNYMMTDSDKAIYHYREFVRLAPPHLRAYVDQAQMSLHLLGAVE